MTHEREREGEHSEERPDGRRRHELNNGSVAKGKRGDGRTGGAKNSTDRTWGNEEEVEMRGAQR